MNYLIDLQDLISKTDLEKNLEEMAQKVNKFWESIEGIVHIIEKNPVFYIGLILVIAFIYNNFIKGK